MAMSKMAEPATPIAGWCIEPAASRCFTGVPSCAPGACFTVQVCPPVYELPAVITAGQPCSSAVPLIPNAAEYRSLQTTTRRGSGWWFGSNSDFAQFRAVCARKQCLGLRQFRHRSSQTISAGEDGLVVAWCPAPRETRRFGCLVEFRIFHAPRLAFPPDGGSRSSRAYLAKDDIEHLQ